MYGQTTPDLVTLLQATKVRGTGLVWHCLLSALSLTASADRGCCCEQVFNVQEPDELTSEWLEAEVQKGAGVR
eukprot:COSAG04_NODE_1870_length_5345_cov_9.554878_5_plen_73_part_00